MKMIAKIIIAGILLVGCNVERESEILEQEFSTEGKQVIVYTTAEDSDLRLSKSRGGTFISADQSTESEVSIFVNPNKTFQSFWGIGGAITDASAEVFAKLSEEKQKGFLKAYYDVEEGIGYTLARTPIHCCDFSSASFTYVSDEDKELNTFNIDHDKQYRIPLIKKAIQIAGGKLPLYASPWSPPAFMKSNKNMLNGGKLLPEYYEAWALYYTKFIKEYEKEGMPIWGITIQNEQWRNKYGNHVFIQPLKREIFLKTFWVQLWNVKD